MTNLLEEIVELEPELHEDIHGRWLCEDYRE